MNTKDKIILVILSILTLGIYPLVIFNKKASAPENNIKEANKLSFKIESLRTALGGEKNIAGAEYTHKRVKIFIKDRKEVNLDNVSKLKGVSGVMATGTYVSLVVGPQAKLVAESI